VIVVAVAGPLSMDSVGVVPRHCLMVTLAFAALARLDYTGYNVSIISSVLSAINYTRCTLEGT
jgi:hypothetical protein